MPKKYDMTGQVYGRLTVLEKFDVQGTHARYRCRCECGRETIVRGAELRIGSTKTCGGAGCKGSKMEAKKDCFAYLQRQGGAVCTALTEMKCLKEECKFYAPLKEVCKGCHKDCDRCLTVSHQKQMEGKV